MTEYALTAEIARSDSRVARWRVAVLVSAAIAISYLDRQTVKWAITTIQRDIPISNRAKTFLDSASFVTYGLMNLGGDSVAGGMPESVSDHSPGALRRLAGY